MMPRSATLVMCVTIMGFCTLPVACKRDARSKPPVAGDKRPTAEVLLVGTWTRASEVAPIVYEQVYRDDGTFVQRQYSQTPGATADGSAKTRRHRRYSLDLPLSHQSEGKWQLVSETTLVLQVRLSGQDPLINRCRIEKITSSQLVVSTAGLAGRVDVTYQRVRDDSAT